MDERIHCAGLQVDPLLHRLLCEEILPGTGIEASTFWEGLADNLSVLMPKNAELLNIREDLQHQIDDWHREHPGEQFDPAAYKQFLTEIGYLLPQPAQVNVVTANVDDEVAMTAGPQLVVPVMNARFALNAANARWGSLYDALYGTDAIPEDGGADRAGGYNPIRGKKVINWARGFLDQHFPLTQGSHRDASHYQVQDGELVIQQLDGSRAHLAEASQWVGFRGNTDAPDIVLLRHNRLHVEIQIDASHPIGATDPAGIKDLCLESALTTIQDCEDSVAAVDAEDKVTVYRNWLGLMRGDLAETFNKGGGTQTRTLAPDREYTRPDGSTIVLPGRSLLFVRNVGHLMTNDAVLTASGEEVPEGILDGFFTAACALHDLKGTGAPKNSRAGSVYIVKPKMHGPDEVSFAVDLFARVEDVLSLPRNTLKIGIIDEERRTTLNLAECINRARERVVFITTGFLDRTGDEIDTCM